MSEAHILYYSPSVNRFADEDWCIVHDLHSLFDNWQLNRWKKTKQHGLVVAKNGETWKLYYLVKDEEDDTDEFDCIPWNRLCGMQMDRRCY